MTASQDYRRADYVLLGLILLIATVLRFWGLDNVGLHTDEEIMAMAARSLLETGEPRLPSGMYYPRALIHAYTMSGSVWLFGESEWAFRLPSAIVGLLGVLAAFFMGRRFLSPAFNLAFVATVALLPGMIEISQNARMYVFLVTCMIWFGACLFRWERDQKITSLILLVLVWLLCLHFQILAIFAAPLLLFPGLSRQSWKQLIQGCVAGILGAVFFYGHYRWIGSKYMDGSVRPPPVGEDTTQSAHDVLTSGSEWPLFFGMVLLGLLVVAALFALVRRIGGKQAIPVTLVVLGLLGMLALNFHGGGLLFIFGGIFWLKAPELSRRWLLAAAIAAAVIGIVHLGILYDTGLYPGRKIIGAMVGIPSIWPVLRFLEYSPVAGALYAVVLGVMSVRFIRGGRLPMHVLFFGIGVWVPLLLLGFFAWYIPSRYAIGQLGYFLLCTFAGLAYVVRETGWASSALKRPQYSVAALVLVVVALVNPVALSGTVNAGYERFPDHKGAAAYIRSLDLAPDAVLIAEDVLQQTYYLGSVDYLLRSVDDQAVFSFMRDGRMVDQYTGVPLIGTGAELEAMLNESEGKPLYVIGSGENFEDGERMFRGMGIAEVLESGRLEVVYEGRDNKTLVWKSR